MKHVLLTALAVVMLTASAAYAVVVSKRVSVASSATLICSAPAYVSETCLVINQDSTNSVFLGGNTGVITTTGLELKAAAGVSIALKQNESLYGITSSASVRVDVLESK